MADSNDRNNPEVTGRYLEGQTPQTLLVAPGVAEALAASAAEKGMTIEPAAPTEPSVTIPEPPVEPEPQVQAAVPARLKGKTKAQIYEEWTALEAHASRVGNEVGELRDLTGKMIQQSLETARGTGGADKEALDNEAFQNDPIGTIRTVVAEAIAPLTKNVADNEVTSAVQQFDSVFPDFRKGDAETDEFEQFVLESPYRRSLYTKAAKSDLGAAAELAQAWEESEGIKTMPRFAGAGAATPVKAAIRKASTVTGSGVAGAPESGPIYSEIELAKLYASDREKYNSMIDEIATAYAEGRVKRGSA